jgi:hypothetical protein
MRRVILLLAVSALLGLSSLPADDSSSETCSSTFCNKCAAGCCPTSTGGCVCCRD